MDEISQGKYTFELLYRNNFFSTNYGKSYLIWQKNFRNNMKCPYLRAETFFKDRKITFFLLTMAKVDMAIFFSKQHEISILACRKIFLDA